MLPGLVCRGFYVLVTAQIITLDEVLNYESAFMATISFTSNTLPCVPTSVHIILTLDQSVAALS